ncbi:MAG: TIGR00645 family protein [Alphaproteobacteria bacterium]|nr:TIGR00645 family protein [Alphaproteobacteria bacterium]
MAAKKKTISDRIEMGIFNSRWLMAPFYIGLTGALVLLLICFVQELIHAFSMVPHITANDALLASLSLIDLSLAGNLVLIVIFSGYENFVSKIDTKGHEDDFEWRGSVDFSTLKLKLVSSIVAISGIYLLRVFMEASSKPADIEKMKWQAIIHVVFVASGVMLALMDRIAADTKVKKKKA